MIRFRNIFNVVVISLIVCPTLAHLVFASEAQAANRVGEVVAEEVETISRRFESREYAYFAIGPHYLTNAKNENLSQYFAGGYIWDSSIHASVKAVVETVMSFDSPKTAHWNAGLGGNYYLTANPTTPFVTADFGYGGSITTVDKLDNVVGFSVGTGVGMAFFRTAGTQLQILARYQVVLKENKEGKPGFFGVSLGILY
jgi:hypothetical protein